MKVHTIGDLIKAISDLPTDTVVTSAKINYVRLDKPDSECFGGRFYSDLPDEVLQPMVKLNELRSRFSVES